MENHTLHQNDQNNNGTPSIKPQQIPKQSLITHNRINKKFVPTFLLFIVILLSLIGFFTLTYLHGNSNDKEVGNNISSECITTGCSGSGCVDKKAYEKGPKLDTVCTYTRSDKCIDDFGRCEVQSDGKCGWTKTPQLTACLMLAK